MKSRRGQALVEFILIIPVIVFVILCLIDVGSIIVNKSKLEDETSEIIDLYTENRLSEIQGYAALNHLSVNYETSENYITIKVSKNVSIMTPGLNNILGKNMKIETERVIYREQ